MKIRNLNAAKQIQELYNKNPNLFIEKTNFRLSKEYDITMSSFDLFVRKNKIKRSNKKGKKYQSRNPIYHRMIVLLSKENKEYQEIEKIVIAEFNIEGIPIFIKKLYFDYLYKNREFINKRIITKIDNES